MAVQKKVGSWFCFLTAREECICSVIKILFKLCSLRRLNGAGCEEVYTNLFETSSVWQVFKVGVSSVPWDSLEVKKIIKVKFLWIIAATAGRFYDWVSMFLEKRPSYAFRGTLSLVVVPKWFHNGFLCLCSLKIWQSVSWYNLDKELNGIKDFLKKKQFFLYWIRHRYQSKTCVEHIEQVIDKSLINSTNSFMNLLYFFAYEGYML